MTFWRDDVSDLIEVTYSLLDLRCQVYAIGGLGRDMSTYLEAVEVFDTQQQAWSELKLNTQHCSPFKRAFFAAVARG